MADDDALLVTIIPSGEGSSYLMAQGRTPQRVRIAGGTDALGLRVRAIERKSLFRMVTAGFLHRVEVTSADFLGVRDRVKELADTIATGVLTSAFRRDVAVLLGQATPARTPQSPSSLRALIEGVITAVSRDRAGSEAHARELLSALGRKELSRFASVANTPVGRQIAARLKTVVLRYVERHEIPEYLSIVLMEIVSNLQAQTMKTFARGAGMEEWRLVELYRNDSVRSTIRQKMEAAGRTSTIGWTIHVAEAVAGTHRSRLEVSVITSGSTLLGLKEKVEEKRTVDVTAHSMADFYAALPESTFNIDLGLYYLSYLHALCRKNGLMLDARVQRIAHGDYSVLVLKLLS